MFEQFPLLPDSSHLVAKDFDRFSASFSDILKKHLPTTQQVCFCQSEEQVVSFIEDKDSLPEIIAGFQAIQIFEQLCLIHKECLMLAFAIEGNRQIVAIVKSNDPVFLQKVREDWLLDTRMSVEREFLLLKQARVDSQTGLLNLSNLHYLLSTHDSTAGLQLILLELPPRRSTFYNGLRHSRKCAIALSSFIQGDSVLHYLGHNTYALILRNSGQGEHSEVESTLVAFLRREGCHKVHVGSSSSQNLSRGENVHLLLSQAWTALRHAAKRGPFSFCDYSILAHPEKNILAPPSREIVRKFSRMCGKSNVFCLVQFHSDNEMVAAPDVVPAHIDKGTIVSAGDDVFVFLEGAVGDTTLEWAKSIIRQLETTGEGVQVSAGISCYPYGDFKKSEMVFNCRKALLHAAFYGKGSAALFDATSLNISGDIYYSDGDLTKAVKEYRRGLKCDSHDVNIYNSLGATLAMMNRLAPAVECFKHGLGVDGSNFMALYNLGLAEQASNKKNDAFMHLEKALAHYSDEDGGKEILNDLKLQLGILSCENGQYETALTYLVPWYQENKGKQEEGRVYYYLGEAYYGTQDNKKAMELLQRALRFDEFDDRAMDLLGRAYLEAGEGDEIALSLCRKCVELRPSNLRYRLNLASVQLQCRMLGEARANLHRCLKNKGCRPEAQLLLGKLYMQEGSYSRAKNWFEKVVKEENVTRTIRNKGREGVREIIKKQRDKCANL